MIKRIPIILLLVLSLICKAGFSQTAGYNTYKFLTLPNSAKITALGGYLPAIMDEDVANINQNPALLNKKMNNRYSLNVSNYFGDIQYGYMASAINLKKYGDFGIGIQYIDYGDFETNNDQGDVLGTFTAAENLLSFTYSNHNGNFSYGTSFKTIFTQLENYASTAVAFDLGGTYSDTISGFTASFVLKNMGTQVQTYHSEKESLPFEAVFGLSKKLQHAPFRFSLTLHDLQQFDLTYIDPNEQSTQVDLSTGLPIATKYSMLDKLARHVSLGTELLFSENFQLRVGYNHQKRKELAVDTRNSTVGFSWGFGIKIKKIDINYASGRYHLAGNTNMFSLAINPSDFFRKKQVIN